MSREAGISTTGTSCSIAHPVMLKINIAATTQESVFNLRRKLAFAHGLFMLLSPYKARLQFRAIVCRKT